MLVRKLKTPSSPFVFSAHVLLFSAPTCQLKCKLRRLCANTRLSALLYKAAVSLCVCVSVCTPLFFRHDRLTAAKFGTHMRIDPGVIRTKEHVTHPRGVPRGILGGQKFKSGKCYELPRKSIQNLTPAPSGMKVIGVTSLGNFMNCREN